MSWKRGDTGEIIYSLFALNCVWDSLFRSSPFLIILPSIRHCLWGFIAPKGTNIRFLPPRVLLAHENERTGRVLSSVIEAFKDVLKIPLDRELVPIESTLPSSVIVFG